MKGATAGAAGMALASTGAFANVQAPRTKPNLLFIHADQQHFGAISGLQCPYVHTPNIDRLVERGVTFTQSYSSNPICCPARGTWYTGRCGSETGLVSNETRMGPAFPDLGQWFSSRGYEAIYSGKWHIPGRDPSTSFRVMTSDPSGQGEHCDVMVSRSAQAFLADYSGDKPFFLSLGFLQPHDCCYWAFSNGDSIEKLPYGLTERNLPPLPKNFSTKFVEAQAPAVQTWLGLVKGWVRKWTPLHWRYYMWSYYRQVEMMDAEIGRVLDALEDSRFADNTLLVFTSDHGDALARRRLIQKWTLYDETARVPLIIVPPGGAKGRLDTSHVISGLDIAPTLCDYAGIERMPDARGASVKPLVDGRSSDWREFVVSEANLTGRMVRTPEYKLISYKGEEIDQLFDMRADPWEMRNLAGDAGHADTLKDLRKMLASWESRLVIS